MKDLIDSFSFISSFNLFTENPIILSILILNEKFHLLSFPEIGTYISSLSLAGFHVYNLKYCQCASCECTPDNK